MTMSMTLMMSSMMMLTMMISKMKIISRSIFAPVAPTQWHCLAQQRKRSRELQLPPGTVTLLPGIINWSGDDVFQYQNKIEKKEQRKSAIATVTLFPGKINCDMVGCSLTFAKLEWRWCGFYLWCFQSWKDRGRERQTVDAKLSWIHGPAAQSGKPSPSWGVLVATTLLIFHSFFAGGKDFAYFSFFFAGGNGFFYFLHSEKHII